MKEGACYRPAAQAPSIGIAAPLMSAACGPHRNAISAATLSSASDKNSVLAKANQADRAADMDRWISSYELKPPK